MEDNIVTYDEALMENLLTFQLETYTLQLETNTLIEENHIELIETINTGFTLLYVSLFVILGYQIGRDFLKGVFK